MSAEHGSHGPPPTPKELAVLERSSESLAGGIIGGMLLMVRIFARNSKQFMDQLPPAKH